MRLTAAGASAGAALATGDLRAFALLADGGIVVAGTGAITTASGQRCRPLEQRAVTRAIKFDKVPPLAATPPLPGGRPSRSASQATMLLSRRVRLGESSSASKLLFRPAQIKSPTTEAPSAGGSRWAKAPGWLGL